MMVPIQPVPPIIGLEQVKNCDHLCSIYESSQERLSVAVQFMRLGLCRGEKCIYIGDDEAVEKLGAALQRETIDGLGGVPSNALVLATHEEAYFRHGSFDRGRMVSFWQATAAAAVTEGFVGLRTAGDTEWLANGTTSVECWLDYESEVAHVLSQERCFALCQYNRHLFPPQCILEILRHHRTVIAGGAVCENFYYVPPGGFAAERAEHELERLLSAMRERGRVEHLLREKRDDLKQAHSALGTQQEELRGARSTVAEQDGKLSAADATLRAQQAELRLAHENLLQDVLHRRRAEALLAAEKHTLEMIAEGAPLPEVLNDLCAAVDAQCPALVSTVLLMDSDGRHLRPAAGPRVPPAWRLAITPIAVGPTAACCGTAAFRKEPVKVCDIAGDPLWSDYREAATVYGLHACWSAPLLANDGAVLGTFALYYIEPRCPEEDDFTLLERATHLARIALEKERGQNALRTSEQRFRSMVEGIKDYAIFMLDAEGRVISWNAGAERIKGYTEQEILGRHFSVFFPPDDIAAGKPAEELGLAAANGHAEDQGWRVRNDGSRFWADVVITALRTPDGELLGFAKVTRDLTDRKQAGAELEKAFDEIKDLKDRLYHENVVLREEIDRTSMFEEIIGSSPAVRSVLSRVAKVAPTDSTVLITGESGTGKELIARAVHKRSPRGAEPFVAFNCAGIPASLVASELFGHEKGAFTGAQQRRLGRFELAEGGTIFLDEIGELPAETQIALLRVIQEKEFERVGAGQPIATDVRVLAATNRDLQDAVAAGSFRLDLFYRLNVFPIEVPPLRERRDDIPTLLDYFIKRYAAKAAKKMRSIDKKTIELFKAYHWPGNIRELQNVIERSIIVCDSEIFCVDPSWLSTAPLQSSGAVSSLAARLQEQEKSLIEAALTSSRGRIAGRFGAAANLGVPSSTLESKIKSLGIKKSQFKPD